MRKLLKIGIVLLILVYFIQPEELLQEKKYLRDNLIRLHVVANSDTQEDQQMKLMVKDAIVAYLDPVMKTMKDPNEALVFLKTNTEEIMEKAQDVLKDSGSYESVQVSVEEETFDTRAYDTFSLPAGVYQTLKVCIGEGAGQNWWCVTFPSLCMPCSTEDFENVAVSFGFSEELTESLSNDEGYELRFYFLDRLGKLENLFFHKD